MNEEIEGFYFCWLEKSKRTSEINTRTVENVREEEKTHTHITTQIITLRLQC